MRVHHANTGLATAAFLIGLGLPSSAFAGPCLDIVFTGAGTNRTVTATILDELMSTGKFSSIERITLDLYAFQADNYDATYVFYGGYDTREGTLNQELSIIRGDRFQRYIEDGGAIVITQATIAESQGPGGTFRSEMMPISSERRTPYGVTVDAIPFPAEDPLFAGVENLSISERTEVSTHDVVVNPAATVHARWPDGRPMVASLGSVIAINVWGVSTTAGGQFSPGYPADSDMSLVIANSLVYAAGQNPATACNGDYDDDGLPDDAEGVIGTDFQNPDSDADGFVDGIDTCPLLPTNDNTDLDGDGQGDACDTDWDGDGVDNSVDNCPRILNATQNDADSDGLGDACGDDWDADSVLNDVDNCPRHSNAEQEDHDDDGVGDACTPDDGRICGVVAGGGPMGLGLLVGVLLMVRRRRR